MHALVFNLLKALILAAMAVAALIVLGAPIPASVVFGTIVLVFGSLHVASRFVYGFTALIVFAAACSMLVPMSAVGDLVADAGEFIQGVANRTE